MCPVAWGLSASRREYLLSHKHGKMEYLNGELDSVFKALRTGAAKRFRLNAKGGIELYVFCCW